MIPNPCKDSFQSNTHTLKLDNFKKSFFKCDELALELLRIENYASFLLPYPKILIKTSIPFIYKSYSFPKNSQNISKKISRNSQDFENITPVNFPITYVALRGQKPFQAGLINVYKKYLWPYLIRILFLDQVHGFKAVSAPVTKIMPEGGQAQPSGPPLNTCAQCDQLIT